MTIWFTVYSWVMSFVYPSVNTILLIASLAAARNPIYRREFICMAISAGLNIFPGIVTLFLRLDGVFHLSNIPLETKRLLLLLSDVAEVSGIIIYCIGFLILAYRLYEQDSKY